MLKFPCFRSLFRSIVSWIESLKKMLLQIIWSLADCLLWLLWKMLRIKSILIWRAFIIPSSLKISKTVRIVKVRVRAEERWPISFCWKPSPSISQVCWEARFLFAESPIIWSPPGGKSRLIPSMIIWRHWPNHFCFILRNVLILLGSRSLREIKNTIWQI